MQDTANGLDTSLAGLESDDWRAALCALAAEHGSFHELGPDHFATFIDEKSTLLVTFESVQGIRALSPEALPLGFDMVKSLGWSHLCLIADGDTWFRDPLIYGYFDRLIDEGFFEDFDQVIFYGAGPCGYAAAAFSVAAPGATVVAVQPQATLDPRMTEWDDRFVEMRRVSFTDRYGYAPDMLDAAEAAYVLYDPAEQLDAMHAALFRRPNVTRLRLPNMGDSLQTDLIEMRLVYPLLTNAAAGRLRPASFARLYRARREHPPYLRNLMARLERDERFTLAVAVGRNVTARMNAPKIRRRMEALLERAEHGEIYLPDRHATG